MTRSKHSLHLIIDDTPETDDFNNEYIVNGRPPRPRIFNNVDEVWTFLQLCNDGCNQIRVSYNNDDGLDDVEYEIQWDKVGDPLVDNFSQVIIFIKQIWFKLQVKRKKMNQK